MQRDLGQNLAVQIDAGGFQAMDELAVRYAGGAAGRIDADDPDSPVVALLAFAADVGELEAAVDGLHGRTVQLALGEEVTGSTG
jgi:hypothetical protein